jgi:hypothetical protein
MAPRHHPALTIRISSQADLINHAPTRTESASSKRDRATGQPSRGNPRDPPYRLRIGASRLNAQAAAKSTSTAPTLNTAEAFKALAAQGVAAGPDGERVNRFLIDRCGLRSPTL